MRSRGKHQIATQLWRFTHRPALEFAVISYKDFYFAPHFHEHYVILLVTEGVNLGQRCREKYEVQKGEMLFINPGEMHTGNSFENKALQYFAFYPTVSSINYWLEKIEQPPIPTPGFNLKYNNPLLSQSFQHLFNAVTAKDQEPLATDTALMEFFNLLATSKTNQANKTSSPISNSKKFMRAKNYIRDNFTESFSLDDLAAAAEASPYYLIRLFKQHSGMTPFDYLRSFRVEQAKRLMRTRCKLTEVAYQSGFYDQSHFIRSFKKQTGFLPSDFQSQ